MKIRVALIDDHTIVREGLRSILEREPDIEIVGEAGDGRSAIRIAGEKKPAAKPETKPAKPAK